MVDNSSPGHRYIGAYPHPQPFPQPNQQPYAPRSSTQCQIYEKINHSTLQCRQHFNHAFTIDSIPQTFASMRFLEPDEEVWYPDTGAFNHMIANPGILFFSKPYIGQEKILVGNENLLNITQIGET